MKQLLIRYQFLIFLVGLTGLTLFTFREVRHLYFFDDDWLWLVNSIAAEESPRHLYSHWNSGYFRPLGNLYKFIVYYIFKQHLLWTYWLLIANHIINAVLTYLVSFQLTRHRLASYAAALLYSVLFVDLQAVISLAAVGGMLKTTFALLTILLFLFAIKKKSWLFWLGSFFSYMVGLLLKETVFPIAVLLFGYTLLFEKRSMRLTAVPHLIATYLWLGIFNVSGHAGTPFYEALSHHNFWTAINIGYQTLYTNTTNTLLLTAFPIHPVAQHFYAHTLAQQNTILKLATMIVTLGGIGALSIILDRNKQRRLSLILLWLLGWVIVTLLPYIGIVSIAGYNGSRYFDLTVIGVSLLLTTVGYSLSIIIRRPFLTVWLGTIFLALVMAQVHWTSSVIASEVTRLNVVRGIELQLRTILARYPEASIIMIDPKSDYISNVKLAATTIPFIPGRQARDLNNVKIIEEQYPPMAENGLILVQKADWFVIVDDKQIRLTVSLLDQGRIHPKTVVALYANDRGEIEDWTPTLHEHYIRR